MRTITSIELAGRNDNEISAMCGAFIEAMARTEPYSPEWRMAQWSLDSTMRERSRRLRRLSPGGP